jgi:archaellum component FlaC
MLTNVKSKAKSEVASLKKDEKPSPGPSKTFSPNPLPPLRNVRSSFIIEPIFTDKPLDFPDVTTLCSRIKEISMNSQSLKSLNFKSISDSSTLQRSAKQLSEINDFIKTCEIEKTNSKKSIAQVIKGAEGIQSQMTQVVSLVQKLTKRPNQVIMRKKKENDCYYTRVQIKKLINELRACTKHIN